MYSISKDEFERHWPALPVNMWHLLRNNIRPYLSQETRIHNACYMVGAASVYRELGTISQETYTFLLALIGETERAGLWCGHIKERAAADKAEG
jgi:hypothetical protein